MVDDRGRTDAAGGQALQFVARGNLEARIADLDITDPTAVVGCSSAPVKRVRRAFDVLLAVSRTADRAAQAIANRRTAEPDDAAPQALAGNRSCRTEERRVGKE